MLRYPPLLSAVLLTIALAGAAHAAERPAPRLAGQDAAAGKTSMAPDFQPEGLWDGRKIVPFKALDDPKLVKASEAAFLSDEDYVLGLTINGESRAYPTRFVWWHHFVNDRIGDTPFLISYCSVCNTGIRFDTTVAGKARKFDFYGLYNGVVVMCERETETVWTQVSGQAVQGPLQGARLKKGPLLDTTWGQWKKLHPDTLVMSDDTPYRRFYSPKEKPEPRGYDRFPAPFFRPTVIRGDKRLPPFDKVLAVALATPLADGKEETFTRRAYPVKALQEAGGVVNDNVGAAPVTAFLDPSTQTACAFSRVLEGKTLTFEGRKSDGRVTFHDRETGSRWNIEGKAEEGPLAGKSLERLENHLSQWYGWSAYFPDTSIYGRTDPPQPGNPFEETK